MRLFKNLLSFFIVILLTPSVAKAQDDNCHDCACLPNVVIKEINAYNFIEGLKIVRQSNACFEKEWQYTALILGVLKDAPDSIKRNKSGIIKSINFYSDRFGLAYDAKIKRYGFVDKNLKTQLAFIYEEAKPFSYDGWGTVVKYQNTPFLIDTLGNKLKLATDLGQLDNTTQALMLNNRDIKALPASIGTYKELETLIVVNTRITTLPKELGDLKQLKNLYLWNNQLTSLPKELGYLSKLEQLNLDNNKLTSLPRELENLFELRKLEVSLNKLTSLPKELGDLISLETLILNNNIIKNLPKELGNLKNLKNLRLENNQLTNLPKELGNLKQLQRLSLWGNQLQTIPDQLGNLKKMVYLEVVNNQLVKIPKTLSALKSLEHLDLRANKLVDIPKELGQLKKLQVLQLSSNQLTNVPKELSNLKHIENLDLSDNQLINIPKELGQLKSLQILGLSDNQLINIPKEFGQLKSLQILDVYNNKLTDIPKELGELKSLEHLDVRKNQLDSIPQALYNLVKLKALNLGDNKLTFISNEIGNLKLLEVLLIGGNKITDLPSTLCDLPNLFNLSFCKENPLKTIPDCLKPLINRIYGNDTPPESVDIKLTPSDSVYQAAQRLFTEKNYVETYKAMLLSAELDTNSYEKQFNLSFYALFVGEYQIAIKAAQKTLTLNSEAISVESNSALAYLLDNQYDKAQAIYTKWAGKKFNSSDVDVTNKVFLQDIKDLEDAGVVPKERVSDVERIKKILENQ